MTTSEEYDNLARGATGSFNSAYLPGIKEIEIAKLFATLSVAAAIREQTEVIKFRFPLTSAWSDRNPDGMLKG